MRALVVLLLSCASLFGADSVIQVFSTAKTNAQTSRIDMEDVFTRDGQTNLVRRTRTSMTGVVQIRIHRFYHAGVLVGDYVAMRDSSGLTTEAGCPYSVSLECDATHAPKSVVVGTKDGTILDAFSFTNEFFTPIEGALISKANAAGSLTREVIEQLSERRRE